MATCGRSATRFSAVSFQRAWRSADAGQAGNPRHAALEAGRADYDPANSGAADFLRRCQTTSGTIAWSSQAQRFSGRLAVSLSRWWHGIRPRPFEDVDGLPDSKNLGRNFAHRW